MFFATLRKSFVVFLLGFLLCNTATAQEQARAFGVFTPAELALKQCDFDTDAEAVVLSDIAQSTYNENYNLITRHQVRIKILKESGIERGNIRIPFYSDDDFEFIRNIEGVVMSYNDAKDPVWSKLDHKLIYTKKLNNYYSEISFALPNIKVGSILEYRYESQMKHYGGLREWVFQNDIPVLVSSYHLTIVPNAEFNYSVYKSPFLPVDVKPNPQEGSVVFEMHNIPGLKEEAYMGAASDYLQRVKFQFSGYSRVESDGFSTRVSSKTDYTTTWSKLAKELLEDRDFGTQLSKTLSGTELLQLQWAAIADPFSRMKQIHDYVRSACNWNQIHTKYAPDGIKSAWEKKTGTAGEINLILINLLKAANLQAEPLLVSERQHGKVDTSYPYVDQFNKVVAFVTLGNKSYILDGTDRQTPSFMVPYELLNTTAFIVRKKNAALINIKNSDNKNLAIINIAGVITPSGTVQLDAAADYYDYSKIDKKQKYKADKNTYQKDFLAPYNVTRIDSFEITGLTSDTIPLHHTAKLDCKLEKTGNYVLLNYNLFTGLDKNPFSTKQRFSDINFGCPYSCILNGTFDLPPNYTAETLPKPIQLIMPDKSMSVIRNIQQVGNSIQVVLRIDFAKTLFYADEYPDLQAFYKQMMELLKEPVVLKTKA